MILLENNTDFPLQTAPLEAIAKHLSDRDTELLLVDQDAIRKLNQLHRGIDRPTDVLSFPLSGEQAHIPLGTIVISLDHARQLADALGHTTHEEIALLFIHGLLHLLGYDHETDEGRMRQKEQELIAHFSLPSSLIVRTEAP